MITNKLINVVELVKTRRARRLGREKSYGSRVIRIGVILLAIISVAFAAVALGALPFYFFLTAEMPEIDRLEHLFNPLTGELLQPTELYDSTGKTLILSLAPEGIQRRFVLESQIPWLSKAFVASNQPDFWQSNSSSWFELTTPTDSITEHLISNVFLSTEDGGWLKNLRTNLLANEAINRFGKSQVLSWALNSADFGNWAFGAESAAQLYFGKPAADLNLAESALLAAVAQAPALNPHDAPELAISYQRLILTAMREQDLITIAEFDAAISTPLVFAPPREQINLAPDFTLFTLEQLEAELGRQRLLLGGLEVTTTLDLETQQSISSIAATDQNWFVIDPVNNRLIAIRYMNEVQNSEQMMAPFIYLGAFANGFSSSDNIWTTGIDNLVAENGPMPFRQALGQGIQSVTNSLLEHPGISQHYSHLLEVAGLVDDQANDPWRIGQMYSLLSQNGLLANQSSTPNTILFAATPNGTIEVDHVNSSWQAIISPEITFQVNNILRDITYWQGFTSNRSAAFIRDSKDQWQIAYSPQRVVMIWSTDEIDPGFIGDVFEFAHISLPVRDWDVPAGLTSITVCVPSGQLPDEDCPQTRREWFVRGNEPLEYDTLFQRFAINSLTGKLATVFTSAEFIQERVYLMVPQEAEAWALDAGILLPPVNYDPIPDQSALADDPVRITRPVAFTEVSGVVRVFGTLGEHVVGFDVQVGQGLHPTEWLLVTEGGRAPTSVALAAWNTEGLSGIWAIQLQVWNEDGSVTRAYTVVTIE